MNGLCKNCKWREYKRHMNCFFCQHPKLADDVGQDEAFRSDALLYEYSEGGGFIVGENFGCVHFEAKHRGVKETKENERNNNSR